MSELHSFLWFNNIPPYVSAMFCYPFSYWWTFGFLSRVAMNICPHVFVDVFFIFSSVYLGVELPEQIATLCLIVLRLLFKLAASFCVPTSKG